MPREVCVQNEFFDLIVFSIKQNVLQWGNVKCHFWPARVTLNPNLPSRMWSSCKSSLTSAGRPCDGHLENEFSFCPRTCRIFCLEPPLPTWRPGHCHRIWLFSRNKSREHFVERKVQTDKRKVEGELTIFMPERADKKKVNNRSQFQLEELSPFLKSKLLVAKVTLETVGHGN